jgi:hypothetical protein
MTNNERYLSKMSAEIIVAVIFLITKGIFSSPNSWIFLLPRGLPAVVGGFWLLCIKSNSSEIFRPQLYNHVPSVSDGLS